MPRPDIIVRNVRVDDAEALAHILNASNEAALRGRVPDQCLTFTGAESASNWRRTLAEGLPQDDCLIVATPPEGVPLGYAWGGAYDDPAYRGELRQIAIMPSAQRKGIGRLLVGQVAGRLAARGIRSMRVEVLQINPNRAFYGRLGARHLADGEYDWDGVVLANCVYGWADTRALLDG